MIITETSANGIVIVALEGRLDALSAPKLRGSPPVADPKTAVVLDLEKVDFMDSSGLGAIVGAAREKGDPACGIVLSCMNNKVRRTFETTNAQRLFHIFDDTSAAVDFAATRQIART
ncbi:anti-sigma factor antagonist [Chlorobaculum sp. 24CR]|uniref:STAS domain-containing protein n=1 Tax=Chlorobaculum sp. 24CR TaxID=2508878 RepID=UPI00100BFD38|nr:STAS domain-containing protein [Chlorobaculum sp. 24CR]RXK85016.1 anti-sigma factor antagonist [Chlorobaculum sp. 24CR]